MNFWAFLAVSLPIYSKKHHLKIVTFKSIHQDHFMTPEEVFKETHSFNLWIKKIVSFCSKYIVFPSKSMTFCVNNKRLRLKWDWIFRNEIIRVVNSNYFGKWGKSNEKLKQNNKLGPVVFFDYIICWTYKSKPWFRWMDLALILFVWNGFELKIRF